MSAPLPDRNRGTDKYVGRFAPSPTGPLHAGSLVAALASWLDARAWNAERGGTPGLWLVRIEDVDQPRCVPGAAPFILQQLATCGLVPDAPPLWQSTRGAVYQQALDALVAQGNAYPCACSRKDIADALAAQGHTRTRHAELPYPGTCRHGLQGLEGLHKGLEGGGRVARSWRFNTADFKPNRPQVLTPSCPIAIISIANGNVEWHDRRLGPQAQQVAQAVGDFVLRRADGLWAYQLAVVVDDAAQGITDVVRGEDLADNTPRQILLHNALGVPTPRYLHTPLVCGANGEKLSKQNGAQALDLADPVAALSRAAQALGLPALAPSRHHSVGDALAHCLAAWRRNYNRPS